MTAIFEVPIARRYLLGQATDQERDALEQDLFDRPETVDLVAAAEDDLIEDYLAGDLVAADRERFEKAYLSSEQHRVRVETVRRLRARAEQTAPRSSHTASGPAPKPSMPRMPWLALAASVLIAGSLAIWMFSPLSRKTVDIAGGAPPPASAPPPARDVAAPAPTLRVFALNVSPVGVRGTADGPAAVIPAGTDRVAIQFESDGEVRRLSPTRAVIAVVGGREVWRGPAASDPTAASGVVARAEIPARNLATDDYVITLFGADPSGREVEWAQYFLRVRER